MAYTGSEGTDEYHMGASGVHPGSDVPLSFNWAAYWDGHDAVQQARRERDRANTFMPSDVPSFHQPDFGGGGGGGGGGGSFDDAPIWTVVVLGMLAIQFWIIAAVIATALLTAGIYALCQIPAEDYAAAWDRLKAAARAVRSGCSRTARAAGRLARFARERLGPPLRAAATAAHEFLPKLRARMQPWLNSVARKKRQKAAQRRGRPLPPVERFKRR